MRATAAAGSFVLLVACTAAEPEVVSDPNGSLTEPGGTADDPGDAGDAGDAPAVITVDGTTYVIPNFMGGKCHTVGDPARNQDLAVFGFADSGPRVELSFTHQGADSAPSGQDEYYGQLGIAAGSQGQWLVTSLEPWPWLAGDRSSVSATVTMADTDGNAVEVSFSITCP